MLHTFVLGRHFIIPTVILTVAVVAGNLAWHGLQGRVWVKHLLFWSGFLLTCQAFFALFWAKRYRERLGGAFDCSACCSTTSAMRWLRTWRVLAPAYLESPNPRNLTLYRRHGFEVMGKIRVGRAPPMVPMFRPARL